MNRRTSLIIVCVLATALTPRFRQLSAADMPSAIPAPDTLHAAVNPASPQRAGTDADTADRSTASVLLDEPPMRRSTAINTSSGIGVPMRSITDSAGESGAGTISLSRQPVRSVPRHDTTTGLFSRKTLALGGTVAFSVPIVFFEYQWWWRSDYKYARHPFTVHNDGGFENENLGVDKCGHFFTSYVFFRTVYDLMKWADYDETTAILTAFAVPTAHAVSIELCDGFAKYGFSWHDLAANTLGMSYAFAQTQVPYLQNFNFKWSFYSTSARNRIDNDHGFSHDYSGHTYWLSIDMKNVLPKPAARYWPKYLNLAMGYGAKNVSFGDDRSKAKHKFAIALDYNLSAIPIANDTWAMVVRFIDNFHFPAPGIKAYSDGEVKAKPFLLY